MMCVRQDPLLESSVCTGHVMHARHRPTRHHFRYPVACLRLPLGAIAAPRCIGLLGVDRGGVFSFRREEHGPRDGSALEPWLRGILAEHGLAARADGEVVLQCFPRLFGYVFNPVSLWFCHDRAGTLRVVLAEVNNTFGEHHNYLLHHDDLSPIGAGDTLVARKIFHVSPFFPVSGEYRFAFRLEAARIEVRIDYWDGGERMLSTSVGGSLRVLDARAMRQWLLRHPFMTLGVMARIHWQALRLWLKRVPFFSKPVPPVKEVSR